METLGGLNGSQNTIERDGFVLDVEIASKCGIHWNEVVHSVHLDAVACEVNNRNVRISSCFREVSNHAAQGGDAEIALEIDGRKTRCLEKIRDSSSVASRICKAGHIAISRVADNESDTLLGQRLAGNSAKYGSQDDRPNGAHQSPTKRSNSTIAPAY